MHKSTTPKARPAMIRRDNWSSQGPYLIDLKRLDVFLNANMDAGDPDGAYEQVKTQLDRFRSMLEASFTDKTFLGINPLEWKALVYKNTSLMSKSEYALDFYTNDDANPFYLHIVWFNSDSSEAPEIGVYAINRWSNNRRWSQHIVLKRRNKKINRKEELLHYWTSGKLQEAVSEHLQGELIPFNDAMKMYIPTSDRDINDRKFKASAIKAFTYLYAQGRNNSHQLLSTEPIDWDMPKSIVQGMSSGLADALQDGMQYLPTSHSDSKKFMQKYPNVDAFMKLFDSRYL